MSSTKRPLAPARRVALPCRDARVCGLGDGVESSTSVVSSACAASRSSRAAARASVCHRLSRGNAAISPTVRARARRQAQSARRRPPRRQFVAMRCRRRRARTGHRQAPRATRLRPEPPRRPVGPCRGEILGVTAPEAVGQPLSTSRCPTQLIDRRRDVDGGRRFARNHRVARSSSWRTPSSRPVCTSLATTSSRASISRHSASTRNRRAAGVRPRDVSDRGGRLTRQSEHERAARKVHQRIGNRWR